MCKLKYVFQSTTSTKVKKEKVEGTNCHNTSFSINMERVLESVPFRIFLNLVPASKPACVPANFQPNHCNQECVINEGHCTIHDGSNSSSTMADHFQIKSFFFLLLKIFV